MDIVAVLHKFSKWRFNIFLQLSGKWILTEAFDCDCIFTKQLKMVELILLFIPDPYQMLVIYT